MAWKASWSRGATSFITSQPGAMPRARMAAGLASMTRSVSARTISTASEEASNSRRERVSISRSFQ